jgi:hypothetical protein
LFTGLAAEDESTGGASATETVAFGVTAVATGATVTTGAVAEGGGVVAALAIGAAGTSGRRIAKA